MLLVCSSCVYLHSGAPGEVWLALSNLAAHVYSRGRADKGGLWCWLNLSPGSLIPVSSGVRAWSGGTDPWTDRSHGEGLPPLQTVAAASGAQGEGVLGFGELMWRDVGSPFGRERRKELHVARRWEEVGVRGL